MKRTSLNIRVCILMVLSFAAISCQQMQEEVSLCLQFNMTQALMTRSDSEGTTVLNYVVKDGEVRECEWSETVPQTKAGDGNPADGGGMADLSVFLVDNTNDNIVARTRITDLGNVTTQSLNFLNLTAGEYAVYAYANTEGNDWFQMPAENETSFAPYKDALLKSLSDGIPRISNNRMPLTGRQDITIEGGNNSRTVEMLRPVGKITITVFNEREEAITTENPTMGNILPSTGYVFKHNDILPEDTRNPYHELDAVEDTHTIVPGSYNVIHETALYESIFSEGFQLSISYKGANYDFQENLSNNLQSVKQEDLMIKLYKEPGDMSADRFLRMNQIEGVYCLELTDAHEVDSRCFWQLSSSGKQQRGLTNKHYGMSVNMDDGTLSFSSNVQTFKYGGTNDYTTIGEGSEQLTYNPSDGTFSASSNGTKFQFFTYIEDKNGGIIEDTPIRIEDIPNNTTTSLTSIHRNQHIHMNIIFR